MNARFTGCIWPSGIARQDSRNCYFIFVSVGTDKVRTLHPEADLGDCCRRCSLGNKQFHFSISEAQFKVMDKGAALALSAFVMIRNFCPSPVTS